jgi:hypothetical protein
MSSAHDPVRTSTRQLEETLLAELVYLARHGLTPSTRPGAIPTLAALALSKGDDDESCGEAVQDLVHLLLDRLPDFHDWDSRTLAAGIAELLGIGKQEGLTAKTRFTNAARVWGYKNGEALRKTERELEPDVKVAIWEECLKQLVAQIISLVANMIKLRDPTPRPLTTMTAGPFPTVQGSGLLRARLPDGALLELDKDTLLGLLSAFGVDTRSAGGPPPLAPPVSSETITDELLTTFHLTVATAVKRNCIPTLTAAAAAAAAEDNEDTSAKKTSDLIFLVAFETALPSHQGAIRELIGEGQARNLPRVIRQRAALWRLDARDENLSENEITGVERLLAVILSDPLSKLAIHLGVLSPDNIDLSDQPLRVTLNEE